MLLGCEVLTRKALRRTTLESSHTLSMWPYYIFALRNVGTGGNNVKQSLLEGDGKWKWIFEMQREKTKCKFGGGDGGVPSALLKKINWIPRTDFIFGKLLSCFRVGYCKWYFMLSFSKWKSQNALHTVLLLRSIALGRDNMVFPLEGHSLHLFNLQIFQFHLEHA